tara:strand:- start:165 stop:530 length:366 start_codon:yes stop_codon:yes gene_type:complete
MSDNNNDNNDNYVKPPSFYEMAKGFAKESAKFLAAGAPIIDQEGYENRLIECNKCEHLIRKSMRCGECGCLLQAKAKMKTANCPLYKWEGDPEGQMIITEKEVDGKIYKKREFIPKNDDKK